MYILGSLFLGAIDDHDSSANVAVSKMRHSYPVEQGSKERVVYQPPTSLPVHHSASADFCSTGTGMLKFVHM